MKMVYCDCKMEVYGVVFHGVREMIQVALNGEPKS